MEVPPRPKHGAQRESRRASSGSRGKKESRARKALRTRGSLTSEKKETNKQRAGNRGAGAELPRLPLERLLNCVCTASRSAPRLMEPARAARPIAAALPPAAGQSRRAFLGRARNGRLGAGPVPCVCVCVRACGLGLERRPARLSSASLARHSRLLACLRGALCVGLRARFGGFAGAVVGQRPVQSVRRRAAFPSFPPGLPSRPEAGARRRARREGLRGRAGQRDWPPRCRSSWKTRQC